MTKNAELQKNKKRKKDILLISLIILSGALVAFAYMIMSNNDVDFIKMNSTESLDRVKSIQTKAGIFELTQNDIEDVSNLYLKNYKNKGDMTFKGINVEFLNDEILIKTPVSYKGFYLLFTSRGKLNFTNGKITYVADTFKIGNLPLPKSLLISKISKSTNKIVYAEDNLIRIYPSVFPFKINTFKVAGNKILCTVENHKRLAVSQKRDHNIIEETKDKSIEEKRKIIINNYSKINKATDKTSDNGKMKELEKIRLEVEKSKQLTEEKEKNTDDIQVQAANKRLALNKVHDELKVAYSQVESTKEKEVLSIMIEAVGKLKANPSYDSSADQVYAKSIYNELDSDSKNNIKNVLFYNIDGDSVSQLRKSLGL